MSSFINETKKCKKTTTKIGNNNQPLYIQLNKNEKDGFYLETTKRRSDLLKKGLKNINKIKLDNGKTVSVKSLEYKITKGKAKNFYSKNTK